MAAAMDTTTVEYRKSLDAALKWTHGDEAKAHDLVKMWHRAGVESERRNRADYAHEAGKHRNRYVEHCPQCSGRMN